MSITEFLADRLGQMFLHIFLLAASGAFLALTGTAPGVVVLLLMVWAFALAIFYGVEYAKRRHRFAHLEAIMAGLDKKYLFFECVPKPKGSEEKRMLALMGKASQSMIGAVSNAETVQKEYREYIESWVHEIKAPITAAQLMCQGLEGHSRRKLMPQLCQIEDHVDRALFYARAESVEKDFIIRQSVLGELVAEAVEKHRALLIHSGVMVETKNLDATVYTDPKWVVFILGQLIQNAIRYKSDAPVIVFSAKGLGQQVQLCVSDNGIGIPASEAGRIFDRGFTGSNGRNRGGATGMGLYICRRLARFLQVELSVASEQNKGTAVRLSFPSKTNLTQL